MIIHRGNKYIVYDSTGNKKLGEHSSKEKAIDQLRAIEANKHKRNK